MESQHLSNGTSSYGSFGVRARRVSTGEKGRAGGKNRVPEGAVVHKLSGKETLQGISLMYGVPAQDILAANKLWARDDIHTRSSLIIPHPQKRDSSGGLGSPSLKAARAATPLSVEVDEAVMASAIGDFRRATGASEEAARLYLEASAVTGTTTMVVVALQRWHEDMSARSRISDPSGRRASPTREPLMAEEEEEEAAALSAQYGVAYRPMEAPRRAKPKVPEVDNFIDNFYDL